MYYSHVVKITNPPKDMSSMTKDKTWLQNVLVMNVRFWSNAYTIEVVLPRKN
jgi:hypothetical protein